MALRPNHLAAGTILTLHAMASLGCLRQMYRAIGGLVFLCSGSFTCGADVLRPGLGEDFLRPFDFFGVLGVDRDEEVACLDLALRSEEHTSELQSLRHLVCRLLLEK